MQENLAGKIAVDVVWRDIAVSCQCGVADSALVADQPGEDINYFEKIKFLRGEWKTCTDCGKNYRIGLGKLQ